MDPLPSRPVRRAVAAGCIAVLGLTACGSDGSSEPGGPTTSTAPGVDESAVGAFTVVEDGLDPETTAALDAAAEAAFAGVSAPGAIMAVRTPDGTWIATVGTTEWDGSQPMSADLHQRVGSVTKTFTVTALLQLADQGLVSLDDPISKYVPGTANPDATLYQLAAMRSGIPSYTFSEQFQQELFADPNKPWTPEQLVGVVAGQPANFAPGTETEYSNTNTVLLGMVIEQVTGKPIETVIDEQISQPLGLTDTVFPTDAAYPDPHPHGYTLQGQDDREPADATDWNPSWGWAAGAMISDVDDLLVYGRELVAGERLLSPEMQARRIESFDFSIPPNTPDKAYGLGLGFALGWYGHEGELPGFNTMLQHHLAEDITIVVMLNSDIISGECPPEAPTLPAGRTDGPCQSGASYLAEALAAALGHPLAADDEPATGSTIGDAYPDGTVPPED